MQIDANRCSPEDPNVSKDAPAVGGKTNWINVAPSREKENQASKKSLHLKLCKFT